MNIYYGFLADTLLAGDDDGQYDPAACAEKYAEQVRAKILNSFPNANVEVEYEMDSSGTLPRSLQPSIDGELDHPDIMFIQDAVRIVFERYEWVVLP